MKKLLILALTSAFVAAANAAGDWFSVAVSGANQTTIGAEWSPTPADADVANGVISIDADEEIILSPTATKPSPEVKTVVSVTATFTVASDSLETLTGAKTALTVQNVGGTPRYRYWNGSDWAVFDDSVEASLDTPVDITIEIDNSSTQSTTAKITVGSKTVEVSLTANTTLTALAFAGTGSLTSVAATVTPAYATYNNKRYESTAGAFAARATAGGNGDITMYAPVEAGKYDLYDDDNEKVYYYTTSENVTTLAGVFPASGSGAENSPYEIRNLAELKAFQQYVDKKYTTAGKYFEQKDDITLDAAWPGIGVQNGKDLVSYETTGKDAITLEEASRRDEKWNAGAFKGTYDGGNHTISGFQMVGVAGNPKNNGEGLDYCGFFNSVDGATIKNLNIRYAGALFAADTTASTKESGATFVGVAKNSTLQNLTSLQKDANTAVSCSKGFGGIVGYLAAGSSVESCINNVNLTSLANNKVGGIAMICQQQGCSITDCENNGTTTTTSGEHGGIVGYTDTITIDGCVNTAACKMFYHHGGTVTLSGTNKGNATVASYTGNATPGLNFATVDDNVATFVANDALAVGVGKPYKVMATGATATYAFTAPGSIAFDKALVPNFKPTISAATGLDVTSSTVDTVTTYTAAWQTFTVTWKNYDETTLGTATVDYNTEPKYDGEPPTKAATAQYSYTFNGWTPTPGPVTADATYTATFTESVNNVTFTVAVPANTVVTVNGVEYTADTQLSMPYGTEVTITYTPADGYIGESKTQKITVAGDTETISAPSTYVAPVPAVAKIGTTYYETLAAAIGDAANNDTVTLLDDVTLAEALNLELGNKAVTLDLDGNTLTGRTNLKSGSLTIENGTVAGGSQQALNVYGSADSTAQNYSVLTIASDVNVTAAVYGVCMFGATAGSNGYGAVVNIEGTVTTTGTGNEGAVFVSGNLGQNVTGDAHNVINVTGTITSSNDAAIALNGLATVNVKDGAAVTGNTAIAVKRGTLNIQGGTVHATGVKNYPGTPNSNGTEMTGAAISVSDTYSKYGAMAANVTGGTITSDNADAIYKKDGDYKADAPIAVSGGTFSSSVPVEFCADGFIPAGPDATTGKYGVEAGWKITWDVDGEKTVDTVKKGENLTKPADPTKSGYAFKGWTPAVVETPDADATYTAQWEQTATPVVSTAETTLVAVPANCKAADLIDLSNRAAGDVLKVYSKDDSDKCYYTWTLSSEKKWTPATTYKVSEASASSHSKPASEVQLYAGQAAWLTRVNPNEAITVAVVAEGDTIPASVEKGWNMIAPAPKAGETTVALNEVVPAGSATDQIKIPTAGAPLTCVYDANKKQWGRWKAKVENGTITGKEWVSDVEIDAGTGFWYISDSEKTVNLK